jgi:Xaa-Pro aminopeptidase
VGLNSHEGFWITRAYSLDHPEKIEQNMYLALETHSVKGRFGARLEENLVVTDTGYEAFSQFPFEEVLLE